VLSDAAQRAAGVGLENGVSGFVWFKVVRDGIEEGVVLS
jgi:hypothetical protein